MKHEFLNGDAMKEIIIDDSINLFIMWPPYLGTDLNRYGTGKQINDVNDHIIFGKRLAKVAKSCEKALKDGGSLLFIIPAKTPDVSYSVRKYVKKKTKLRYNTEFIWNHIQENDQSADVFIPFYCYVMWFSKGQPNIEWQYLRDYPGHIINIPTKPDELWEKYGQMGHVADNLPVPLAEHLIKIFTKPGDTVANVMGGTGSVSIAAENTERDSVYNDISLVQLTIAKKRMEDLIATKKKEKAKPVEDDEE